jgi:putative ABC transport system substrate-binding protein
MIRRREVITLLGGAAAWPVAAVAQQGERVRRVGLLMPGDENSGNGRTYVSLLTQGLAQLGWVEGRNLRIELRWAAGNVGKMQLLARELAQLRPEVIVVSSGAATKAVQEQTRTIPIIFVFAGDPLANGTVADIARPEGNTTGVTDLFPSIGGKWLELLKEATPGLARIALLSNPDLINIGIISAIEEGAARYGIKATKLDIRESADITPALDTFAREPNGGVIPIPPIAALPRAADLVNQAALRHRLPTIFNARATTASGGLMSYGAVVGDLFRHGAPNYVDRILRGAKPNELPVQYSTKFELVINLKTAKALGLEVPPTLLARADEVIE